MNCYENERGHTFPGVVYCCWLEITKVPFIIFTCCTNGGYAYEYNASIANSQVNAQLLTSIANHKGSPRIRVKMAFTR
jgi:hypothetical protein